MDRLLLVYLVLQLASSWIAFNGVNTLVKSYKMQKSGEGKMNNSKVIFGVVSLLGGLAYFVMHAIDFHQN